MDKVMHSHIFTNKNDNTLMREFEGVLSNNPTIKNLDAVVGFLRASGYFTLRPFVIGNFASPENGKVKSPKKGKKSIHNFVKAKNKSYECTRTHGFRKETRFVESV